MHLSPARILNFIRREAVLCCAALAALAYFDKAKANDYIEIYSDDEDDVF